MKMRKEYKDRANYPIVNPGFTLDEYERSRVPAIRHCAGCGYLMDTTLESIKTCFACFTQGWTKGD